MDLFVKIWLYFQSTEFVVQLMLLYSHESSPLEVKRSITVSLGPSVTPISVQMGTWTGNGIWKVLKQYKQIMY